MQIPLIGKIGKPVKLSLWWLGPIAFGILGVSAAAIAITRSRTPQYDVAELTTAVEAKTITVRIRASGNVQPIQTVNLSPKTSGILDELYVEQGDRVEAGQIIARMDSDDLEAQRMQNLANLAEAESQLRDVQDGVDPEEIAQAELNFAAANAQVQDAQARLDLANDRLDRNRDLQGRGAISEDELNGYVNEARSAQAGLAQVIARAKEAEQRLQDQRRFPRPEDLAQAEARVNRARGQLEAVEVRLRDILIRAPFAGVITQKFATEGAFVTPTTSASEASSATSSAIVALANGLEVLAEVPEADISQIKPGQQVEIEPDALPDQIFQGKVRLIAPEAVERQNVTLFQVRIELLSGQEVLLSNMNVNVAFIGDDLDNALVVPTFAINTQEGRPGVLVPDKGNRICLQPITYGQQSGNQIIILEGVEEGDLIFLSPPPGQESDKYKLCR
ncbi:MAG: efflux RND transporter periplasmic adaptor subunit [Leptolyngbyaceae cyanobacterium MO_188.B28]|nr:efflux RND transporter periplasmic adaptor subunit [Leptolyngbyaceae cyanobacterium MO_188.B28]